MLFSSSLRLRSPLSPLAVNAPHHHPIPLATHRSLPNPLRPPDSKLDSKSSLHLLNELADLHSCSNALYFEARRHEDLYMWASRTPNGPSVKCHVQNIHTMDELKMTGNCLKGSRGICVFDGEWDTKEEWKLLKEQFSHVSGGRYGRRTCVMRRLGLSLPTRRWRKPCSWLTPDLLRPAHLAPPQALH